MKALLALAAATALICCVWRAADAVVVLPWSPTVDIAQVCATVVRILRPPGQVVPQVATQPWQQGWSPRARCVRVKPSTPTLASAGAGRHDEAVLPKVGPGLCRVHRPRPGQGGHLPGRCVRHASQTGHTYTRYMWSTRCPCCRKQASCLTTGGASAAPLNWRRPAQVRAVGHRSQHAFCCSLLQCSPRTTHNSQLTAVQTLSAPWWAGAPTRSTTQSASRPFRRPMAPLGRSAASTSHSRWCGVRS